MKYFQFVIVCLVICGSHVGFSQDVTSGLEGYWSLDSFENESTADQSDNGRDAVTALGTPIPAAGKLGNGIFFDGSTHLSAAWKGVQGNTSRTISAWIKTTDIGNGIVGWGANNTGEKWHFRINNDSGNGVVGAIRTEYAGSQTVATTLVNDGQWHHVVSVFEGNFPTDVVHYVDGELDEQSWVGATDIQINTTEGDDITIGARIQGTTPNQLNGTVDEVRVYSRALSAEDIRALYEEGLVNQNRAVRSFSETAAAPGMPVTVNLDIGTGVSGTLTETIPPGWSAGDISNAGVLDGQTITWNLDGSIDSVSYTAEPGDEAGNVFSGELEGLFSDGDIQITTLSGSVGDFDFHADIGDLGAAGSAAFDGNEYALTGSGADIWGSADAFHFAFKELNGPFIIRGNALVFPFESGSDWVKGGLMVRNNLTPGSSHGDIIVRTDLQMTSQARPAQGESSITVEDLTGDQLGDMEIVRSGNLLEFFRIDLDGNRQPHGSIVIEDLEDPVYAGIVITSHDNGNLSELFFSNLEIEEIAQSSIRIISSAAERPTFGDVLTVSIDVTSRETNSTVVEVPPNGWAVSNIQTSSGNASVNANGEIEWALSQSGSFTLTYDLTVPADVSEPVISGEFSGSINGDETQGQTSIDIAGLLPESVLAQQDTETGLIGYWSMDENSGTIAADSSASGFDAIFEGDPTWVAGVNGSALEFDGDDALITPDFYGIGGNNPRTILCWINTTTTNTHGIISWGLSTSNGQKQHFRINDNADNGTVGAIRTEIQGTFNIAETVVNDGVWHMISSTLPEGGQVAVDYVHHVDGLLEGLSGTNDNGTTLPIDTLTDPATTEQEFRIGMSLQGGDPRFFPGIIDEVRVYDRGLTTAEIQAIFVNDGGAVDTPVENFMLY